MGRCIVAGVGWVGMDAGFQVPMQPAIDGTCTMTMLFIPVMIIACAVVLQVFLGRLVNITCVQEGQEVVAVWTDAAGKTCRMPVRVGANFGISDKNKADYACMGRCGVACGGGGVWRRWSVWTQDCMNHDVCSYVSGAKGLWRDKACGDEAFRATDDTLFGLFYGCRQGSSGDSAEGTGASYEAVTINTPVCDE